MLRGSLVRRCGHMSEETVSADKTAAMGIVLAVGCSSLAGLMYVLALMFSVQVSFGPGVACMCSAPEIAAEDHLRNTSAGLCLSC